jgi:putative peptidoglycan lipid II flippase
MSEAAGKAGGDDFERSEMVRNSGFLSINILISRITGLAREMVKAAELGTDYLSDAFSVSFAIPNFMRRLFAEGSMAAAFIPALKGYLIDGDEKATERFIASTFTALAIVVCATIALGAAITPYIVPFFGTDPVHPAERISETVILTRLMFPFLGLASLAALLQGMLNSVKVFLPSSTTTIWFNLIIIACVYVLRPFVPNAARSMAIGVIIGGVFQALYQLPFVLRKGFAFGFVSPLEAFRNPGTRKVFSLIGPTVIGMAAYQINDLVSSMLAGNGGTGVLSSIQFSLRLQELMLGIFAVSIGTVLLPGLSAAVKKDDWEEYNRQFSFCLRAIALITLPVTFFALVQGREIVSLIFKIQNFSDRSVALTTAAFTFHIIGLYAIASNRIIAPAFYAQLDTKSPTWAGIASVFINIALALALVGPMKGGGIALALSVASVANMIILIVLLKRNERIRFRTTVAASLAYALKIAAFSLIAAAPVFILKQFVYAPFAGANRIIAFGLPLLICLAAFCLVGVALLALSRDEVLASIAQLLKRRGKASGKDGA